MRGGVEKICPSDVCERVRRVLSLNVLDGLMMKRGGIDGQDGLCYIVLRVVQDYVARLAIRHSKVRDTRKMNDL